MGQEVWVDGVGFDVDKTVLCGEQVIAGLVCVLCESMGEGGSWCGEVCTWFGAMEDINAAEGAYV